MFFDLEEELKKLPASPGVYLMHNHRDEIIYVGKAVSLKNRVRQYFQSSRNKTAKIQQMVSHIAWFEYILTDSELEALVLECNLIKEHRPRYNTMLKDDKTYPYIKATVWEDFPRLLFSRDMKKDGRSRYFGPYTSAGAVKDSLELIHKLYRIRTCSRSLPKDTGKERPCLNYHIHQCDAPCQGYISKEEYQESFKEAMDFLGGHYEPLLKSLEDKMYDASEKMEFEKAIEYRELLNSVKQIAQKQKITSSGREDRDIVAMARDMEDVVVQVFFIREGKMIGRDHFHIQAGMAESRGEILDGFVKQFYAGTPFIPREVWLQYPIEEEEIICQWLSQKKGQKVKIVVPKKGEKERLVELAARNADLILTQDREKVKREELRTIGAIDQVGQWIGIGGIRRVEAYDISNTSGVESVGSMVVYEDGKPKRSDYRKFKIRTVQGPNDYASMEEVLTRRFSHGIQESKDLQEEGKDISYGSFTRFPDLIMMDGGRGQVNIALSVLERLGLSIPVCGMVKDDNHRTRGLYYNNVEIPIDRHSEGFRLITRIQDEAHRFAIEYHRSLRGKDQVKSILDDIEGIGPARRKALMRYFKDIDAIRHASAEDLEQVPQMNRKAAEAVYLFFHKPAVNQGDDWSGADQNENT
ncbi:MAG: excinuclease ABC subunit UvrC [Enterocloster sp.]